MNSGMFLKNERALDTCCNEMIFPQTKVKNFYFSRDSFHVLSTEITTEYSYARKQLWVAGRCLVTQFLSCCTASSKSANIHLLQGYLRVTKSVIIIIVYKVSFFSPSYLSGVFVSVCVSLAERS